MSENDYEIHELLTFIHHGLDAITDGNPFVAFTDAFMILKLDHEGLPYISVANSWNLYDIMNELASALTQLGRVVLRPAQNQLLIREIRPEDFTCPDSA